MYLACFQDCAGVILYAAENATQVALDAIQILGKSLSLSLSPLRLNYIISLLPLLFFFFRQASNLWRKSLFKRKYA